MWERGSQMGRPRLDSIHLRWEEGEGAEVQGLKLSFFKRGLYDRLPAAPE
jgi:hypothetical protein